MRKILHGRALYLNAVTAQRTLSVTLSQRCDRSEGTVGRFISTL
nr:hypothetical protein [uncultured Ruminococcus sp.]